MGTVRAIVHAHHRAALWLIAAAILVRAIVPAGYMLAPRSGHTVVEFCDGVSALPMPGMDMAAALPSGDAREHYPATKKMAKGEMPCAFSATVAHASAGADPVLLATALLFLFSTIAFGLAAQGPAVRPRHYLRPPLRGPPFS